MSVLITLAPSAVAAAAAASDPQIVLERWRPVLGLQADTDPAAPTSLWRRLWTGGFKEFRTLWSQYRDFQPGALKTKSTTASSFATG